MNSEDRITYFAETDYRNQRTPFGIRSSDRSRHMYVIGKTGMGKSTMLENMAAQDIQNGEGLAFIDPHGAAVEKLLSYVPEERINDVVYFAPFDLDHPVAFNIMEDVGYDRRHLVANGLMSAFKKIWVDAWSARMEYILNNCILALLEYPGSTLLSVNKMLVDKKYRNKVVENITDPSVKSFWKEEFAKYTDRYAQEATPAIQNKIGQFTSNPLIRNIIGQPHSSFDLREAMDKKKIILMNMSKGQMGEQNADLLGSMLVTKIYLAAMSRADLSDTELAHLPNFYFYVDEFQSFANESFADILSEARKYKLNLTIAHQYVEQMPEEVRSAVFGNVGSMVAFRVGAYDAELFEKEFMPRFTAQDIVNLGFAQVYLRLMIDGIGSQPFSAVTMPPIPKPEQNWKDVIISESRRNFAQPREIVSEQINSLLQENTDDQENQKGNNQGKKKKVPSDPPGHPPPPKRNVGAKPSAQAGRSSGPSRAPSQAPGPNQAQAAHQHGPQMATPWGFRAQAPSPNAPNQAHHSGHQTPPPNQGMPFHPHAPFVYPPFAGAHPHHMHPPQAQQTPQQHPQAFAHTTHASPHAYDHSYAHPGAPVGQGSNPQKHASTQTPSAPEQSDNAPAEAPPKKTIRLSDLKKKESKKFRKKANKPERAESQEPAPSGKSETQKPEQEAPKQKEASKDSPLKAALADAISEHEGVTSSESSAERAYDQKDHNEKSASVKTQDQKEKPTKDASAQPQHKKEKTSFRERQTRDEARTPRRQDGVSQEVLERILKVEEEESRNNFS